MASTDFGELLQAAEQLTSEFDPSMATSDLPRVERNLHQLVSLFLKPLHCFMMDTRVQSYKNLLALIFPNSVKLMKLVAQKIGPTTHRCLTVRPTDDTTQCF